MSIPSFTYSFGDIYYDDTNQDGVIDVNDVFLGAMGVNPVLGYNTMRVTTDFIKKFKDTDFRKKMFPVNRRITDGTVILEEDGTPSYSRFKTEEGCLTTKWQSRDPLNVGTGDFSRIRASEMYLIEAEAEARLGNFGAAQEALYVIQHRADNTVSKTTATGQFLIDMILLERRKELFFEGRRFFDLKRLDLDLDREPSQRDQWSDFTRIGGTKYVLQKNSVSHRFCLPIPQKEIDANNNLTIDDQNSAFK